MRLEIDEEHEGAVVLGGYSLRGSDLCVGVWNDPDKLTSFTFRFNATHLPVSVDVLGMVGEIVAISDEARGSWEQPDMNIKFPRPQVGMWAIVLRTSYRYSHLTDKHDHHEFDVMALSQDGREMAAMYGGSASDGAGITWLRGQLQRLTTGLGEHIGAADFAGHAAGEEEATALFQRLTEFLLNGGIADPLPATDQPDSAVPSVPSTAWVTVAGEA